MKRKWLWIVLGGEGAALLGLALLAGRLPALFSSLLAFPLEQLGLGLRALSFRGRVGNGLALAAWAGLSVLPLLALWRHGWERSRRGENAALCLLSALLFFVLYAMTNPAVIPALFPAADESALPVMKAILGGAVWSGAVLWLVLRLLRLLRGGDTPALLRYLRWLLYALCALFTGEIALACGDALAGALAQESAGWEGVMAAARLLAAALPYGLDIAVTRAALELLDAWTAGGDVPGCAQRLSRRCCGALGLSAAAGTALNVLQLVLARRLTQVALRVDIPVMSLAFVLGVLLFSRLIAENRRLRTDNDLFI